MLLGGVPAVIAQARSLHHMHKRRLGERLLPRAPHLKSISSLAVTQSARRLLLFLTWKILSVIMS
jgi:hypothetical protein